MLSLSKHHLIISLPPFMGEGVTLCVTNGGYTSNEYTAL